jgi:hypothetical protein
MSKYDDLLREAKANAEAFALTAREYIPKMYSALREEDPNISPYDAKDRIQKACRRTILDALPSEAKDPKKQKARRLSRIEHRSAAFSAAQQMYIAKKEWVKKNGYNEELQHHDNIAFEFCLPRGDIMGRLIEDLAEEEEKETPLWFSGEIDRHSGKVINVRIGRRTIYHQAA